MLSIENLKVKLKEGDEILKGIDITIGDGEIVAVMGPNGSGKSTLVNAIMLNDKYEITEGKIILDGEDITHLPAHEKAKRGIFVSFQNPPEIEGVRYSSFIPMALQRIKPEDDRPIPKLQKDMVGTFKKVGLNEVFLNRYINVGFSGGERKRAEVAQMILFKPKVAILDEIDSGLDVDALKVISNAITELQKNGTSFLLITHYPRLLHHLDVSKVYVLINGRIVKSDGKELAYEVEEHGYEVVEG